MKAHTYTSSRHREMETVLGPRYEPDWLGVPPHMSSGDYAIWSRYLPQNAGKYLGFYYDVYIIPDQVLPQGVPPELARMWRMNTGKRIDAVGELVGGFELIEVRVAASAGALGAIQMYLDMWALSPPLPGFATGTIITDRVDPVLPALAALRGITVIEA